MKKIIGAILILSGIILGLYMGIWYCFIGGIIDIIEEIQSDTVNASNVAVGIAKIIFAGLIGWLVALCLIIPGAALIESK